MNTKQHKHLVLILIVSIIFTSATLALILPQSRAIDAEGTDRYAPTAPPKNTEEAKTQQKYAPSAGEANANGQKYAPTAPKKTKADGKTSQYAPTAPKKSENSSPNQQYAPTAPKQKATAPTAKYAPTAPNSGHKQQNQANNHSGQTLTDLLNAAGTNSEGYSDISYFVQLINGARKAAGLNPVTLKAELKSGTMVRTGEIKSLFSHTRPNGQSFSSAANVSGRGDVGEIIAMIGSTDAAAYAGQIAIREIFNGYMNSPSHRSTIMNPKYNYLNTTFINGTQYRDGHNFFITWNTTWFSTK